MTLQFINCEMLGKLGFHGGSDGKESACNAGDLGSIPGSGTSLGEGDVHPTPQSASNRRMSQCKVSEHWWPWGSRKQQGAYRAGAEGGMGKSGEHRRPQTSRGGCRLSGALQATVRIWLFVLEHGGHLEGFGQKGGMI